MWFLPSYFFLLPVDTSHFRNSSDKDVAVQPPIRPGGIINYRRLVFTPLLLPPAISSLAGVAPAYSPAAIKNS